MSSSPSATSVAARTMASPLSLSSAPDSMFTCSSRVVDRRSRCWLGFEPGLQSGPGGDWGCNLFLPGLRWLLSDGALGTCCMTNYGRLQELRASLGVGRY
jgi:hypothetical protein